MQTCKVTLRLDRETKRPILFFINENDRGYWLECYDRIGQHSECSREYMLACPLIHPLSLSDDAQALLKEWNGQPGDVRGIPSTRLVYPRQLRYIGR